MAIIYYRTTEGDFIIHQLSAAAGDNDSIHWECNECYWLVPGTYAEEQR